MARLGRLQVPPPILVRMVSRLINLLERVQSRLLPAPAVLLKLTSGGLIISRSIYVAAELGIADLLQAGPRSTEQLAHATRTDALALYRVLRALASVGIFAETRPGVFKLTPLADYLRTDKPGSMRAWARYAGADFQQPIWGALLESVKNGRSAYENVHGMRFFAWMEAHPEAERRFDEAMTSLTSITNPLFASSYDFSGSSTLMDIADGRGSLLATILRANPHLGGILFDLPQVIAGAQHEAALNDPAVASRRSFVGGSFFEEVPATADIYMMKWILHDWNDDESIAILQNIRRALRPGGKLLVIEMVITPDNAPSPGKLLDLAMLTQTGGMERTEAEYRRLFEAAGLDLARVLPTASVYSIMECVAN